MAFNPYATSRVNDDPTVPAEDVVPTYSMPLSQNYGVPSLEEGAPYVDYPGWAPELRTSTTEVPSAQRLGTIGRYDYRPDPTKPPQEGYWQRRAADTTKRHSVEKVDANGWDESKGIAPEDQRWAYNPRLHPPAESRVTQKMAPRGYSFTRPYDGPPRTFNGMHFSMADHRRTYPILGMAPIRSRRNTYRLEPPPWDIDVVDMPPDVEPDVPQARIESVEVPYGSRAWRLGG